jgi:hypothetical protein
MKKQRFPPHLPFVVVALLSGLLPHGTLCAADSLPVPSEVTIEGQDHHTLKDFFKRFEQDKVNRLPSEAVSQVLYRALPEAYKKACEESVNNLGDGAAGTAGMTVKVVYAEGEKEGKPIRALVGFACSSKGEAYANEFHDERLAALEIDRRFSRLSILKREEEQEKCPELVRIMVEKELRTRGKGIVGLNFARSDENASGGAAMGILKEETVNFYAFEDNGIKPAVLKEREERLRDSDGKEVTSVYSASVVLKKDMKGNIVGILSPFTVKRNDGRVAKGMVRYSWDGENQAFVRE